MGAGQHRSLIPAGLAAITVPSSRRGRDQARQQHRAALSGAGAGLSGRHIPDLAVTAGAGQALLRERGGLFRGEIGFCRQARNCPGQHVGPSRTSLDSTRPLTSRAMPPAGLPFRRCHDGTR